jgi:hypothetical protein
MSVLRWEASHLLRICTNLRYGTLFMEAYARRGCSVTDYYSCLSALVPVVHISFNGTEFP